MELLDAKKLQLIVDNWHQLPWTRKATDESLEKAKQLLAKTKNNKHEFKYVVDKKPFTGRQYTSGPSLQSIMREVRNTVCEDYYNDYDGVNTQPTILTMLLILNEFDASLLEDYCNNRDEWLNEIMTIFNCDRETAKEQIVIILNGGEPYYHTKRIIELKQFMKSAHEFLWNHEDYKEIRDFVETLDKPNQIGTFISYVLGCYERMVLDSAIEYIKTVKQYPIDTIVRIFDGFLLEKKYPLNDEDLLEMKQYIHDHTDLEIEFINKPMKDKFDLTPFIEASKRKIKIVVKQQSSLTNDLKRLLLKSLSQSTSDVANVIKHLFNGQFVFTGKAGWYYYKNHRWHKSFDGLHLKSKMNNEVLDTYHQFINELKELEPEPTEETSGKIKSLTDVTFKLRDIPFKNKLLKECEMLFLDTEFEEKLDQNLYLLGFNNGVYDLEKMVFRDGKPDDYLTFTCKYDYIPLADDDTTVQEINQYLNKTFPQPKVEGEPRSLLETTMILYSSFLSGGNPLNHFYIQSNSGSNGKSQIVEMLDKALGDYSKVVRPIFFCDETNESSNGATPETACLKGKRLIHAEEPNQGAVFNIGKIKEITGNCTISARANYGDPFTFRPQFKCLFSCNHKPSTKNTYENDYAIWRRFHLIPFESKFVDLSEPEDPSRYIFHKDTTLSDKMDNWRNAFMNILLKYHRIYKQESIVFLKSMKVLDETYKEQTNPFYEWFADHIEFVEVEEDEDDGDGLTLSQMWNSYSKNKSYYQKGTLKRDMEAYLSYRKYTKIERIQINGNRKRQYYPNLRWISSGQ